MTKITFTICIIALIFISHLLPYTSYAATAAPTKAPDNSVKQKLDQQINQLKDKIASRVSELNLVEKRGVIGTISDVKGNQLTINDLEGNTRFVDVDEITKFLSPASKNFGLSDLTKGTKISILGIYNKQSKRLLARFIKTYVSPTLYSGAIASSDPKNFQITVATPDQKEIKVDVDTSTKLSSYAKDAGLAHLGFSKLAVGNRVLISAFPGKTDPNLLSASRVIVFVDLPKDPNIVVSGAPSPTAASAATPVPTSPGKNIAPIR